MIFVDPCGDRYYYQVMAQKRPRQKKPLPIGPLLQKIMRQVDPKPDQTIGQLQRLWVGIVGAEAANNSRPMLIKKGVLTVFVTNSVWIQQLRFQTKPILAAINAESIDCLITSIRFKVG